MSFLTRSNRSIILVFLILTLQSVVFVLFHLLATKDDALHNNAPVALASMAKGNSNSNAKNPNLPKPIDPRMASDGTPLRVILHVGPGKMATTTIQDALSEDQYELHQDNFCIYRPEEFHPHTANLLKTHHLSVNNNANTNKKEQLKQEQDENTIQEMLIFFDHCYNIRQHMLLSSEFLSHLEPETWEGILKPSLERWNITIALGYRRFYSWAPSMWFQIFRKRMRRSKWPNHKDKAKKDNDDAEWRIPPFHEWYYSDHAVEGLKEFYTDTILKHWKETLGVPNILIYNLHEDTNVVKTLYCKELGLHHACAKRSEISDDDTKKSNEGNSFDFDYDRLACALFLEGSIGKTTKRKKARDKIKAFFSSSSNDTNHGTPAREMTKSCFTNDQRKELLKKSKTLEQELVPDFYASSKGEPTMEEELLGIEQSKLCDVNVKDVLERYGSELRSLFV